MKKTFELVDIDSLEVGDTILVNGRDYCMVVEVSDRVYVDIIAKKTRTFVMPHDQIELVEWWHFNGVER